MKYVPGEENLVGKRSIARLRLTITWFVMLANDVANTYRTQLFASLHPPPAVLFDDAHGLEFAHDRHSDDPRQVTETVFGFVEQRQRAAGERSERAVRFKMRSEALSAYFWPIS